MAHMKLIIIIDRDSMCNDAHNLESNNYIFHNQLDAKNYFEERGYRVEIGYFPHYDSCRLTLYSSRSPIEALAYWGKMVG